MHRSLLLVAVASLVSVGCEFSYEDWDDEGSYAESAPYYDDAYYYEAPSALAVTNVSLAGQLPHARNFEGGISYTTGELYGDSLYVNTYAEDRVDGWGVMTGVSVYGDLSTLTPGTTLRSSADYYESGYESGSNGMYVSVLGCSGPQLYSWEFDQSADEVEVQVGEAPAAGQLQLTYTARWQYSRHIVTGSFTVDTTSAGSTSPNEYYYTY